MSKRIFAWLLTFVLVLALAPLSVSAASIEYQLDGWNGGGSGRLSAQRSGNTITVTGTVSNANQTLDLDIPSGVTVSWGASLTRSGTGGLTAVTIRGGGVFNVTGNGRITASGTGGPRAIHSTDSTLIVSGGTINASGTGNLRAIYSSNSIVEISGGRINVSGTSGPTAIYSSNSTVNVSGGTINASGTGEVRGVLATNNSIVGVTGGVINATGTDAPIAVEVIGGDIVTPPPTTPPPPEPAHQPGSISPTALAAHTEGVPFVQAFTSQHTTEWSVSAGNLPPGVSLDRTNGAISGVPTSAGTWRFTIQASNINGSVQQEFTLVINPRPAPTPPPTPPTPPPQPDVPVHLYGWWHSPTVPVRFAPSNEATQYWITNMRRSMSLWNNSGANVSFAEHSDSGNPWAGQRFTPSANMVPVFVGDMDTNALGYYSWWVRQGGGAVVNYGYIAMNRRLIYRHSDNWRYPRANTITSVFAHELGHAVGLDCQSSDGLIRGGQNAGSLMNNHHPGASSLGPTPFDVGNVNMLYTAPLRSSAIYDPYYQNISVVAASYPHFDTTGNLATAATDVVFVEVLDERVELINSLIGAAAGAGNYNLYTVYRVRVLETFQGNAVPGDILEVRQLGGQLGNETIINTERVPLQAGNDVLIFMSESAIAGNPSLFLNQQQSVFTLADNYVSTFTTRGVNVTSRTMVSVSSFSTTVSIDNATGFTLSLNDLIEISLANVAAPVRTPQPTPQPTTAPNLHTASLWAHNEINNAVAAGLVPQSQQNHYTNNITRAEFTALAVLLYETITGREIAGRVTFNDTTDVNVQKAAYIGIVSGTGGDNFSPNMQFNREQAAVMLVRLFWEIHNYLGTDLPAMLDMPYLPGVFTDYGQISTWASGGVASAFALGIMGGVGNNIFDPQGTFTREQSIVTVWRLFDSLD